VSSNVNRAEEHRPFSFPEWKAALATAELDEARKSRFAGPS
jgi:hypothetical protein